MMNYQLNFDGMLELKTEVEMMELLHAGLKPSATVVLY